MTELTDQQSEAMESAEHGAHAAESGDPMTLRVTLSIAVMAVIGASMGSFGEIEAGHTFVGMNEAVLAQTHASDQWTEFQSDSIKSHIYDLGAALAVAPDAASRLKAQSEKEDGKKTDIEKAAKADERERDADVGAAEGHFDRHHRLTYAELFVHVAIAVASVALLSRRRSFWFASLGLTAIGIGIAGAAYLM